MKFTEEKLVKAFTELLGQESGKVKVQSFVGSSVVKIRASSGHVMIITNRIFINFAPKNLHQFGFNVLKK